MGIVEIVVVIVVGVALASALCRLVYFAAAGEARQERCEWHERHSHG
ncbi:hypothetical protein [Amycolatopsis decaplanina]|nr:hypothetical protein [Amycolatopsis decaplanina]